MPDLSTPMAGRRALGTGPVPRRRLLQAAGLGGAAAVAAACGVRTPAPAGSGGSSQAEVRTQPDQSESERVVNWSSWVQYVDEDDDGNRPTLERFEEATGISVNLQEDINDNAEFDAKVRPLMERGQDIDRDLVVLTDWLVGKWIREGFAQSFDRSRMPNVANLIEGLASPSFDPERDQSMPWQAGYTGLGFNADLLEELTGKREIRTVEELWDPALRGRVTIFQEMRDTVGIVMLGQGADPTDFTADQFDAALAEIQEQIDVGHIRQVTGNDYITSMENGDVVAAIGWSGDIAVLGEPFQFVIPESGGMLWSDDMAVPAMARHKANAELLMDWYYDPEIAAEVAAWVQYVCPVKGAQEVMERIDPELVDNPFIFPTAEDLARVVQFKSLSPEEEDQFTRAFQLVIGN